MSGTFAATPQDAGMFYQWGSKIGWSNKNPLTATDGSNIWRDISETGNVWLSENNSCPKGWRVPTQTELQSLANAGSEWTTVEGVFGRKFGAGAQTVFLSAAGFRYYNTGNIVEWTGTFGSYWSSTATGADAYYLDFAERHGANSDYFHYRTNGFPVRCVKE
jgi:uncharacterized protein (TIGR02145 family)